MNMADCCRQGQHKYDLPEDEAIGFVFPVYFGGLPSVVRHFAKRLRLSGRPIYSWAAITCGAEIFDAGSMLEQCLAEGDIPLDTVFPVKMADNYVVMYKLSPEETQLAVLAEAEEKLTEIRAAVEGMEISSKQPSRKDRAMTKLMYPLYANGRSTAKFYTDERCVGCGTCAARCPVGAIQMEKGRPVWVRAQCSHCMACMRCKAVQYGKKTAKRERWTHPDLRKKPCHE